VPPSALSDQFERFFALSSDLLAVASFDGRFLEVNDAWTRTLGWSREELLSEPYMAFVHPDDVARTAREAEALDERRSAQFTNRYRAKDGGWRRLEWVSEPCPDEGVIYVIARDVTERHEAFEFQRQAEERHRRLIENLPDTVITKTDTDLVVTYVGGGGLKLSGLRGEDFIGRRLIDIYEPYAPRVRTEMVRLHERALDGVPSELFMKSALTADAYELRILPLADDRGTIDGTMVVATNVTKRVSAERENRQLASLVAATGEAILAVDLDGTITWVNPRACEVYGYASDELVGRPVTDLLVGDHGPVHRAIDAANRAGESYRGELENVDRFGREFPVSITVSPLRDEHDVLVGRSVLVRDVSERKATEARLNEANRRFEQALIHAPSGMAIVDLDGCWIEVNDALCRIVGYSHEELLSKTFVDITHPDDIDADVALVQDLIFGERDSYEMEKRYIRKDGSEIWILLTVSCVRDETGRALHFISQILDIDERKREEQQLRAVADNDGLTGLVNRRRFTEILTKALAAARRHGHTDALLFIDLDGFKAVNDGHGHSTGDELLRVVAQALSQRLRGTDVVARYGGDEFVVLLDRIDPLPAARVAEELGVVIAEAAATVEGGASVTASIGMTMLDGVLPATADAAFELADAAMYRHKLAGR
jgi:diguanylate cyclase (GGDEF)-like protein/PAS domain S-box-containing protein